MTANESLTVIKAESATYVILLLERSLSQFVSAFTLKSNTYTRYKLGRFDRNPAGTLVIPFLDRYSVYKSGRFVKTFSGIIVNRLEARFLRKNQIITQMNYK